MNTIYMDNNATTKVADEVISEMTPYMGQFYGNPSSMHTFGGQVGKKLFEARSRVASLLGCGPEEIIFTSCGTEGDNTAIRGVLATAGNKRKIITTRVELPAVLGTCRELEQHGYNIVEIGVDKLGRLDIDELSDRIGDYVLVMKGEHVIIDSLTTDGRWANVGVHGGTSEDEMHVPLIMVRC
jgi:cysteine desulfurase